MYVDRHNTLTDPTCIQKGLILKLVELLDESVSGIFGDESVRR